MILNDMHFNAGGTPPSVKPETIVGVATVLPGRPSAVKRPVKSAFSADISNSLCLLHVLVYPKVSI